MTDPKPAAREPAAVEVEAGKKYAWCACGLSQNQPFCDGTHKGTDIVPKIFTAAKSETVYLCQCKQTKNGPFCDGSHQDLDAS